MLLTAQTIKYGDDINTDLIIAGKYTKTLNVQDLVDHAMEDLDPDFHEKCKQGRTIVVAGDYFGCGSSREQAPVALKESGIQCVAAKSFSRIFYRNAINIGLPLAECDTSKIDDGDVIEYAVGGSSLRNLTKGITIAVAPLPDIMVDILGSGGMVEFAKQGKFDQLTEGENNG